MIATAYSTGKKLVSHPIVVTLSSFGFFLSGFAFNDYNRNMEITEEEMASFKQRKSKHLGESLEQLHSKAFLQSMTYNNIKVNRNRCVELFFLHHSAEKKKLELKDDPEFKDMPTGECEELVASEFYEFGQRMCRRAMIRNGHFIKWFKAIVQDEFIKYYIIPILGYFGARHYKIFDGKVKGGTPKT